jgi:ubiquinone/menaquinone biosynthesis C-methylase UbiE
MANASADRFHTNLLYQHPLAYLLGLEGLALLRAYSGVYDRQFTLDRFAEIRELLDNADQLGDGVEARPIPTREGYASWSAFYDEPGNELIDIEEPIVHEILAGLPIGTALDAACGTGRHAAHLASLGHAVIGTDTSPEMLAIAREKVPAAEFHESDLYDLQLDDSSVDLVVCSLALTHVPDVGRALAELVRVLRPNGHLVTSDSRGLIGDLSPPAVTKRADGTYGYMQTHHRLASDYLEAALPLRLEVRRCVEPKRATPLLHDDGRYFYDDEPPQAHVPGDPPNIWALHGYAVAATNAAFQGNPVAIIWHFQLAPD